MKFKNYTLAQLKDVSAAMDLRVALSSTSSLNTLICTTKWREMDSSKTLTHINKTHNSDFYSQL